MSSRTAEQGDLKAVRRPWPCREVTSRESTERANCFWHQCGTTLLWDVSPSAPVGAAVGAVPWRQAGERRSGGHVCEETTCHDVRVFDAFSVSLSALVLR